MSSFQERGHAPRVALALNSWKSSEAEELSVERNDLCYVLEDGDSWSLMMLRGKTGWVPNNFFAFDPEVASGKLLLIVLSIFMFSL